MKILLVEDNAHVHDRLKEIILGTDISIIGAFFDLKSAYAATSTVAPDVIILDLKLPDVTGTDAILAMLKKFPTARLAIYTAYENEADIISCMMAGAHGYLLKDTPDDRLLTELRVIAQGGSTLTPRVAQKLIKQLAGVPSDAGQEALLTQRELEVLNLISLGLKYEDISDELMISVHTVRHHIESIYKKLGVNSRGQAVAQALRSGIIKFD